MAAISQNGKGIGEDEKSDILKKYNLEPADTADNTEFQKESKMYANFMAPKKAQQLVDPWVDSAMPSLSQRTAKVANRKQVPAEELGQKRAAQNRSKKGYATMQTVQKQKKKCCEKTRLARSPVAPMSAQKAGHAS